MSFHFSSAGLVAAGYTGANDAVANAFNSIMGLEITMAQAVNLGTPISALSEATSVGAGVSTNITGGNEVGGRY